MPATVLPAAEVVVIDWAMDNLAITALVGTDNAIPNISGALPTTGGTTMPYLVISSVPGGLEIPSGEGAALEDIVIQLDAFARKKPDASTLIQTCLAEVREYGITSAKHVYQLTTVLAGMRKINGPRPLVERDHELIRFTADIVATVQPA